MFACFPAGGGTDIAARLINTQLGEALGKPVVVENRGGAGGSIGTAAVARMAPDGHSLLVCSSAFVVNPSLYANIAYDPFRDFTPIMVLGASPNVFAVPAKSEIKSMPDLIARAKANPGKLNWTSSGVGTTPHLAGELVKLRTGIDMTHVPYRGFGAAYPDIMSGKVQLGFSSIAGAVPFTGDNRVKAIATTGAARSAVYPDVPTVAEGGLAGFDVDLWTGVLAPVGLPPAVLAKLNSEISKALAHPEMKAALAKIGVEPRGTPADQATAFTQAEYEKWKKVIVDGKIKL